MSADEREGLRGIRTRAYRAGEVADDDFALELVSEHLDDPDAMVWIDLCGPSADQLAVLRDELGLHELAVEDALSTHQRPKLDHYDTHIFVSCHVVRFDPTTGVLSERELDAFVGDRWMITVHHEPDAGIDEVVARWDRGAGLARHGVSFLLYGLLDVVVDGYFETVDRFDEYYDAVSEGIFEERPIDPARQREWFLARQALVRFHRLAMPLREVVSSVMRREQDLVPQPMYPYFQDVYDHVLRVTESTDALRDLVGTIVETNLSLRDYRQNQVMKKVTSWAAIVAVPTLITGFYGMNVPYPGFSSVWGVWVSVLLMVVLSVYLYLAFHRRDWL